MVLKYSKCFLEEGFGLGAENLMCIGCTQVLHCTALSTVTHGGRLSTGENS